jgi:hypothetical protein
LGVPELMVGYCVLVEGTNAGGSWYVDREVEDCASEGADLGVCCGSAIVNISSDRKRKGRRREFRSRTSGFFFNQSH